MNDPYADESFKTLLVLLEKAEQILSIINLSDPIVRKYNQLKEMTFDKLGLEFKPLIKNFIDRGQSNHTNTRENNINSRDNAQGEISILWELIIRLKSMNNKKNSVIEFLLDLIEKFKFENNNVMKQMLGERDGILAKQLDKLMTNSGNNNFNTLSSRNLEDFEFDLKMEEIKLKDFLGKSEITYKRFLTNLKYSGNKTQNSSYLNMSEDMTCNSTEDIVREYEKKIEELRRGHERDIKEFRERFNDLRAKYNPELENDFCKLKADQEDLLFLIEKVNEMLNPVYDKYYQKNASWYENEKIDFKFRELDKLNFLTSLVNKFFVDNKYLIDLVSSLQKEKSILLEERNLPYVANTIQKHSLLAEIQEDTKIIEANSDNFQRNFDQIMDFIDKNFENIS